MPVIEFVMWVAVVATSAAFMLLLSMKWGWREWMQVHAPDDFIYRLLGCDLCCCWWLCVAVCVAIMCCGHDVWQFVFVAPCATVLARKLL